MVHLKNIGYFLTDRRVVATYWWIAATILLVIFGFGIISIPTIILKNYIWATIISFGGGTVWFVVWLPERS